MMVLVLLGLIVACAQLWRQVSGLRARVHALESAGGSPVGCVAPVGAARWAVPTAKPLPASPSAFAPLPQAVPTPEAIPMPEATPMPEAGPVAEPRRVPERGPTPLAAPAADPAPLAPTSLPQSDAPNPAPGIGFEELFGRRLPIWAGGVTLAVAGFLIVRWSIDAGLLSPAVRVVLGLLFGAALIAGAEAALRGERAVRDDRVRQALAGAGIATWYGSILVAANLYALVGPGTAFVGLAGVTLVAGLLSIRFGAPSAVLGLLGGLAAPALVHSGQPDVPLLCGYLALAVGGLTALSRTQRWAWLGTAALAGGFGWGLWLVLGGALDAAASLSVGGYLLLLGIGLPLLAGGPRRGAMQWAGSLVACAQIAALVAQGGFGLLDWGLFGLLSVALVWLSRREPTLSALPGAGLAVALLLALAWPHPATDALTLVLAGVAGIYGGTALYGLWRKDGGLIEAAQVAAIAAAVVLVPLRHAPFDAVRGDGFGALALLGAGLAGAGAALGWRCPTRREDARFAVLATMTAALVVLAGLLALPFWAMAPLAALLAAALLLLGHQADDPRLERSAWSFAAGAGLLLATDLPSIERATGAVRIAPSFTRVASWTVPALAAILFGLRTRTGREGAQSAAVLLGYVAAAQVAPLATLPLIPPAIVALLAWRPASHPAAPATAAALALAWSLQPVLTWLAAGGAAIVGVPQFLPALPPLADVATRVVPAAVALGFAALRVPMPARLGRAAVVAAGLLACVAVHTLFRQLFAIRDAADFVTRGLAERTVWEALLGTGGLLAWRADRRGAALALTLAALLHFCWFTLLLHDPLWAAQSGAALVPAYASGLALLWLLGRLALPPAAERARGIAQMAVVALGSASLLRLLAHGAMLSSPGVDPGEQIGRSVLGIALAVGFLLRGVGRGGRDWRIGSLLLMLTAVAKVFLLDAAGLDGLLRIASFAALGFSLIGIGWLYSRHLAAPLH